MRKTLLFLISFLVSFPLWAVQRTSEEALEIARAFFTQQVQTRSTSEVELVAVANDFLQSATTRGTSEGNAFYVFNRGTDAYVIVSGDDRMKSVLAYSDKGAFNTTHLPDNLLMWMELCNAVYQEAQMGVEPKVEPKLMTRSVTLAEEVLPMLKTENGEDILWDQSAPYNLLCPKVSGRNSVTGCVATAMAQIMRYWREPAKGIGSHNYVMNGQTVSFDFSKATFDWDKMRGIYSNVSYTQEEAAAVAELMFACGVAVDMSYSPNGSGAYSQIVPQAMIDYFGFNENMNYLERENYTSEEWIQLLKSELNAGRPVYYSGQSVEVGHAFVFDGYDKQGLYHVNWGWSGMNNGYYEIISLDPESPGMGGGSAAGGGFVFKQGMIVGFQPKTEGEYMSNWRAGEMTVPERVKKNEIFVANISEIFNYGTTFHKGGKLGLVAEKDGVQTVLGAVIMPEDVPSLAGYRVPLNDCKVPAELADGTYTLYPASREKRDTRWRRARAPFDVVTMFTLTVNGDECTMLPFTMFDIDRDMSASIEVLHNLYSGHKGAFRLTYENLSTKGEYYGMTAVAFLEEDNGELNFIGYSQLTQLLLAPESKETQDANVDMVRFVEKNGQTVSELLAPGDYYVAPASSWGDYIMIVGEPLAVTVREAIGTPSVEIKVSLSENEVEENQQLTVDMTLRLTGRGNVYSDPLMILVADSKGNGLQQVMADVFVEGLQPVEVSKSFVPQVSVGNYLLAIFVKNSKTGRYEQATEPISFTVTAFTAIEEDTAGGSQCIKVYGQPVDSELRFAAPANAEQVNIFASSGMLLYQGELSGQGDGTYTVPADKLSSGYYILTVKLSDGTMLRGRFIKR